MSYASTPQIVTRQLAKTSLPHTLAAEQKESSDAGSRHQDRLLQLELPEKTEPHESDYGGRYVEDSPQPQDHHGTRDGATGRRGRPAHEGTQLWVVPMAAEPGC